MDFKETQTIDPSNPVVNDMFLDETGNPVFFKTADFADYVAQKIRARLEFFEGEWFLDLNEGVPYFRHVLTKIRSEQTVNQILLSVVRETPGVVAVPYFAAQFDTANRSISVDFRAVVDSGQVIDSADFAPFVVKVDQSL